MHKDHIKLYILKLLVIVYIDYTQISKLKLLRVLLMTRYIIIRQTCMKGVIRIFV